MKNLKYYLRLKRYSDTYVNVYTYDNMGEKVHLFGNKAKILNLTLGFTFLDCDVSNVKIYYMTVNDINQIYALDIIINYRGGDQ